MRSKDLDRNIEAKNLLLLTFANPNYNSGHKR